jgi:hypothetical protein
MKHFLFLCSKDNVVKVTKEYSLDNATKIETIGSPMMLLHTAHSLINDPAGKGVDYDQFLNMENDIKDILYEVPQNYCIEFKTICPNTKCNTLNCDVSHCQNEFQIIALIRKNQQPMTEKKIKSLEEIQMDITAIVNDNTSLDYRASEQIAEIIVREMGEQLHQPTESRGGDLSTDDILKGIGYSGKHLTVTEKQIARKVYDKYSTPQEPEWLSEDQINELYPIIGDFELDNKNWLARQITKDFQKELQSRLKTKQK